MFEYEDWYEEFKPKLNFHPCWEAMDALAIKLSRLPKAWVCEVVDDQIDLVRDGLPKQWQWMVDNAKCTVRVDTVVDSPELHIKKPQELDLLIVYKPSLLKHLMPTLNQLKPGCWVAFYQVEEHQKGQGLRPPVAFNEEMAGPMCVWRKR